MKKKIIFGLGAVIVVVVTVLALCGVFEKKMPYDAKLYSDRTQINGWVKKTFLDENKVYEAYYVNPNWEDDSDAYIEEYYQDKESPKTRTYIIKDEETFKEIFYEDTLDINFEEEMVIIHIFTTSTGGSYELKDVQVDGEKVTIKIELEVEKKGVLGCIQPYQRYVVIKMQKVNVAEAEVKHL